MAVPGLRPHVAFEEQLEPKLVNRQTGGALPLTSTETWLLRSWDGSSSATRLSAAVFMHGVDIEPWQVEQVFARLERLGCLLGVRPQIPNFVGPTARITGPDDLVPRMRGDLLIVKVPRARAVFHVKDPISHRAFTLFDTEVSVARMLDGKRTVRAVIDNAAKLGIPVSLEALQAFISHLRGFRFIDEDVEDGNSTWPARKQWTDEERQLYQASMKNLREGHFAEALSFAESLASSDPNSPEAQELKHRVEVEREGVVELTATFERLHGPPSPEPETAPARIEVPKSAPSPAPPSVEESDVPSLPSSDNAVMQFVKASPRRAALLGGGLVLAVVLLRPVQGHVSVACELQAESLGAPRTMRGGKVGAHDVELDAKVEKGAVLAHLGAQNGDELVAKLKVIEGQLAALPPPTPGKKAEVAKANVKKLEGAVAALEKAKKTGNKKQQAANAKKLAAKQKELEAARKSLDAFTHDFKRAELEAERKTVQEKKVVVDAELARSIIVAPAAGVFVSMGPLPETLAGNEVYGLVAAPNFKVVAKDAFPAGAVEVKFKGASVEVEGSVVDGQVVLPVRSALIGAKGTLEFTLGWRPWVLSL